MTPEEQAAAKAAAHGMMNFLTVMGEVKKNDKGVIEKSASGSPVCVPCSAERAAELVTKSATLRENFATKVAGFVPVVLEEIRKHTGTTAPKPA